MYRDTCVQLVRRLCTNNIHKLAKIQNSTLITLLQVFSLASFFVNNGLYHGTSYYNLFSYTSSAGKKVLLKNSHCSFSYSMKSICILINQGVFVS